MPSSGRFTARRTITIVTSPASGMPAAPMAASVAVRKMTISSYGPSAMPDAWAMKITATASYRAVPSMLIVAPSGQTNFADDGVTRLFSMVPSSVTGSVAELDAVENAVANACPIPSAYSRGERRAMRNRIRGSVTTAWKPRPVMTVSEYMPIFITSARNSSPPPALPSRAAMSANTPTGARYMMRCTIFMMASLTPSKIARTFRPFSPSVVRIPPNTSEKTMTGSISMSDMDFMMFVLNRLRIMSVKPIDSLPTTRSGIAAAPSATRDPGWMMITRMMPRTTARPVVAA